MAFLNPTLDANSFFGSPSKEDMGYAPPPPKKKHGLEYHFAMKGIPQFRTKPDGQDHHGPLEVVPVKAFPPGHPAAHLNETLREVFLLVPAKRPKKDQNLPMIFQHTHRIHVCYIW